LPDNSNQPAENARRRIVIPLSSDKRGSKPATSRPPAPARAPEPAAPRRRSRLARVLGILAVSLVVVLALVAGGIFLWWQHHKTTPAYALAVLIDASQNNDLATVQSVIDTDQVVRNLADEVTDKAASRYGVALGTNARERIRTLTPTLMPRLKATVEAALVERVKAMSQGGNRLPFFLLVLAVPRGLNIAVSEDNNSASVQVPNQPGKLEMSHAGGSWKVVAFRDETLVQRAIDQVIKDLPAIGRDEADPRKRVNGMPALRVQ